jgi:hypothetical protein
MIALLAAAVVAGAAAPASPGRAGITFLDGAALQALCARDAEGCGRYVMGVADAVAVTDVAAGTLSSACIPDGTQPGQLVEVVRRFLADHPDDRDGPAPAVVMRALRDRFRCARPNTALP